MFVLIVIVLLSPLAISAFRTLSVRQESEALTNYVTASERAKEASKRFKRELSGN